MASRRVYAPPQGGWLDESDDDSIVQKRPESSRLQKGRLSGEGYFSNFSQFQASEDREVSLTKTGRPSKSTIVLGLSKTAEVSQGSRGSETTETLGKNALLEKTDENFRVRLQNAGLREDFSPFPHQVQGVKWMIGQEEQGGPMRGGILADDMGLGKTLQVVCLLLLQGPKSSVGSSSSGGSLILCPKSVINVWLKALGAQDSESSYVQKGTFRVHEWMGSSRTQSSDELSKHDVVITTYETYRTNQKGLGIGGAAGQVQWTRVVLDEATKIKNQKTATFSAAASIKATFRWALTATPIENSIEDFKSLLSFVKYSPGSGAYPPASDLGNAKTTAEDFGDRNFAAAWLKVLQATTLRRTKNIQLKSLAVKEVIVESLTMSPSEQAFYENVKKNGLIGDCGNHLVTMLRLRQAANTPELAVRKEAGSKHSKSGKQKAETKEESIAPSSHNGSTKIDRLLHHLRTFLANPDAKIVIFSSFTGMLDVLEKALECERVPFARLDGTMTTVKRQAAIARYEAPNSTDGNSGVPVFLISLKAGGTGLTLLGGSRPGPRVVILFDHWWNPATEAQAIDRVHRIGQNNRVTVVRFIMKNSIEETQMIKKDGKDSLFRAVFGPIEDHRKKSM